MNGQRHGVTRRLAEFAHGADVPTSIHTQGQALLADASRRCEKGVTALAIEIVISTLHELGRHPDAGRGVSPIGRADALSTSDTAMINAMAIRSTYEDASAEVGHVAVAGVVLSLRPEVFAPQAVDAFCVGAEVNYRILHLTSDAQEQRGWDAPSLVGCLGATLAASRLLSLSIEQTEHAVGIALTQGSGLRLASNTMTGPLQVGLAAQHSVMACLLALQGFTGPTDGVESRRGVISVTAPDVDISSVDEGLATEWATSIRQ
jgi:2-methylcitrate dehydratase PrpD